MTLSKATLEFGERMAEAILGVDRRFRAESGDPDGLVVVNLDTGGRYRPADFPTYQAARTEFAALARHAERLPEPDRRVYYGELCDATAAFIDWREERLDFAGQLRRFLRVPAEPASEAAVDSLRAELAALLAEAGYQGPLAARCAAWEQANRVAADAVPAALADLMDEAWTRTECHLLPIPASRSDGMTVTAVSGVAFNARCDYLRRTVELNTDPTLTRPALKHLAVHEGCPGHYVQFKLRETLHARGRSAADSLLSVVNTVSSSVFEGIADAGMAMIEWDRALDDRIQAVATRYRAAIGTQAAWRLHALGWPAGEVADWLRAMTLFGGEGWVANRLAFIGAPARAVLIWSYWWGERVVADVWRQVRPGDQAAFLEFLHGRMHSNRSIAMFDEPA
ncbi:MAG: hypothetical protein FJ206_12240 [Gemmatimonadetes bacterium]|nr:hypothetical protein [Gemmatimonadota bacterium]